MRQIIARAVAPEGVVDIFAAAGLAKPDISILSDDFLVEVRGMPQKNVAVELLQKLLRGEISARRRKNIGRSQQTRRDYPEMLASPNLTFHRPCSYASAISDRPLCTNGFRTLVPLISNFCSPLYRTTPAVARVPTVLRKLSIPLRYSSVKVAPDLISTGNSLRPARSTRSTSFP